MGGKADDKMTAPLAGGLGLGSNDIRVDDPTLAAKEDTAAVVLLVEERLVENRGSPARDAEGGIDPRGDDAMGPAGKSTHQSG